MISPQKFYLTKWVMGNADSITAAYEGWQEDSGDVDKLREYITKNKEHIEEKNFKVCINAGIVDMKILMIRYCNVFVLQESMETSLPSPLKSFRRREREDSRGTYQSRGRYDRHW